ncbi:MAG: hypothetical protein PUA60_04345 [Methanobacteriaceae archaeon]|nr:hypothetical protein [Methanobacteriaceae archaeon]
MDTFFQRLRDIQKKERTTGTLSEIEDTFYDEASQYLQQLLEVVDKNPLSLEAYQLRDAQRITVEICERREVKIITTAISNVQKSHDIFKGYKKDTELYEEIPYNVTPEEEKLYKDIVNTIISHREGLMESIEPHRDTETKIGFKPRKVKKPEKQDTITPHEEITRESTTEKTSKPAPPKLDESQIAMMFGQAPDDVLLDENNNPVKSKPKTDITTPFTPPAPPQTDTVTLQNTDEEKQEEIHDNTIEKQVTSEDKQEETEVTPQIQYNEEELVEFKKDVTTDILDENEKTYGPFKVRDVVLLPRSIVKILRQNEVIKVIR